MLINRILALSKLASKDESRHYLNGVWLSWENDKPLLEVTDGCKASREFLPPDDYPKFEGHFFVENEKIPMLKLILKQHKYIPCPVAYDIEADLLSFGMSSEVVLKRPTVKPPPFKQIYVMQNEKRTKVLEEGTEVPECTVIGLDAKYLLEIAEALKDDQKSTVVKLVIKDATSPITVIKNGKDAVLMPCRV